MGLGKKKKKKEKEKKRKKTLLVSSNKMPDSTFFDPDITTTNIIGSLSTFSWSRFCGTGRMEGNSLLQKADDGDIFIINVCFEPWSQEALQQSRLESQFSFVTDMALC